MKSRVWASAALLSAVLIGALGATAASATGPVDLDPGYVTDQVGALSSSERAAAEERLQELADESRTPLFVVFVDEFTDPADSTAWADLTADGNGLGDHQLLLAVAVESRQYALSVADGNPLSDSRLDDVKYEIEEQLSRSDWDGAIISAADEIQGDGGAGFLRGLGILVGIAAAAVAVWLIVAAIRRARRNAEIRRRGAMPEKPDSNDPFSTLTDDEVAAQAALALVRADDAITSSKEELAFAVAQFGDGATEEFTRVVEAAKAKMSEAFDLRQKLDDDVEDTIHERRDWHIRIIRIADEIDDVLDDNTEAFDALRKLEQNAPQELERVRAQRAELQPLLTGSGPALSALARVYEASALTTVADNPAQAQERAALADRSIELAASALAQGDTGEAAFAIRTAEQAIAQSAQLAHAITALGEEFTAIEAQAQSLIAELQNDVATARQLPDPTGAIATTANATTAALEQAQAALAGPSHDPQRLLEALTAANSSIDAAIAQGREAVEQARRTQQMMEQTLSQAGSEIRAARDFIETRRGTVGSTARTRLAQADASLAHAMQLRATDTAAALAEAGRALELARQATRSAQSDVSAYNNRSHGGGYGGGDSGLAGDILGGIIGGLISGGGRSSSRGSSWGSGGYSSSGFGGSSRSSSRSSSSRSSSSRSFSSGRSSGGRSGGSRSRGGRF